MLGKFESAGWRGRSEKDKELAECVQIDVHTFSIAGNWKAMALEAGRVWAVAVTEGGTEVYGHVEESGNDAARLR